VALAAINAIRSTFDWATGYGDNMTVEKYLLRMTLLETVAGIPGMVGAMARHFRSLRTMRRDGGWVHTLLEEAENERMHLLTALELRSAKPSITLRALVLVTQGVLFNAYFAAYLVAPSACHRFVGYLEQEAVSTFGHMLADLDAGRLPEWKDKPAPEIAMRYWRLAPGSKMRDLILAIRADEAIHRDVNHVLASISPDAPNPFL
jgi:hypothetical protein